MLRFVLVILALALAPAAAAGPLTVAAPRGAFADLVTFLARAFEAQSGTPVSVVPVAGPELLQAARGRGAAAVLLPRRISPEAGAAEGGAQLPVFTSEVVLVGSRADRARVRGLQDMRKAARWIAGARALYVASSPQLGVRALEQSIWADVGVNVRARPTWYDEAEGDEAAVADKAAGLGAYVLIERATWAGMRDRRGLEVIAAGDPALQTTWVSVLIDPEAPEARAWQAWLASPAGRDAIGAVRLDGVAPLSPADFQPKVQPSDTPARPPGQG